MGILLNPSAVRRYDTFEQYRKLQQLPKVPQDKTFTTDTIFSIDILNPLSSYTASYAAATHGGTNTFTAFTFGEDQILTLVSMSYYYRSGTVTAISPVCTIRRGGNTIARWAFSVAQAPDTLVFSPRNLLVKKGDYVLVDEFRVMNAATCEWRLDITGVKVTP